MHWVKLEPCTGGRLGDDTGLVRREPGVVEDPIRVALTLPLFGEDELLGRRR